MKSFVYRIMFVLSLLTLGFFSGQATTLGIGDIAFTGYNADSDDNFSVVLLTDVSGTTIISFTDLGWLSSGGFRADTGEGTIRITLSGSFSCGTQIVLSKSGPTWSTTVGSITQINDLAISTSGDQIFAYNGSTAPTGASQGAFIAALDFYDLAGWDVNAIDRLTSALPSIFTSNPGNDFAVAHMDNGAYQCSITSGLPTAIKGAIYTAGNWSFSNSSTATFSLPSCTSFSCTAVCTDPVITSLTTNSTIGSNTFCTGDNVVITVNGTPGDATTWNLYTGSCGGTLVNSTTATNGATFTINSIAATTIYYVGGTGGCVATPTCTAITITVNGLAANAGSDQKISGTTTANISGNGAGTWSIIGAGDGNGYFNGVVSNTTSTIASTTFSGTAGQQYVLRWTVTNAGCPSSTDDVVITFLSQTTLGLGDIAFTGYNSDNPDEFRFVLLKDINAGTQITFTDNGWLGTQNGFRAGENTITYEFCRPYSCGDEFSATSGVAIQDDGGNEAAPIVSGSSLTLAVSGDQIFAYQGAAPTTGGASNWIAAIQMNGAWDANAIDSETSAQPSAFTDGVNSISISPEVDNAKYDCSITTNSPANLAAAVNTASNWTTQGGILTLDFCSFTCGSCVEPVLTSVSAPSSACPGQTVALTINGTLNGANEWAIYTGSCGGTLVGTTTSSSFNVTPTATTTYYVSGRGGCVVTESCQTATISVTSVQADAGPNDVEKIEGNTTTTLQANGGFGDGTWTFVDAGDGQGNISDVNDPAATFSGTAGQLYTLKWTIDNSAASCPDTEDEVTIVFMDQTGLTLGDLAFIAYSADEDDFAFVLLKDVGAGTSIKFTDRGWLAAGGFRGGEGTITIEFCRPYSCGDEFNIFNSPHEIKDASGRLAGTVTGAALQPSTSGDQIFAYQGPETNLITGIQMNGAWDSDATNTNTSAKPAVFTDGINSISISPERQNAYLDCSKVSSASGSQINNAANWLTSNTVPATLPLNCNLACCTPGVATSISGSPGPLCPSSTQTLSVVGSLNDDQEWVWYTGICGGTEVATGANFNVSPTTTTTYYVRAEGTCSGTSGACASITITVEDGVDPVANCPADITVNNDPGFCSAVVSFNATATDNCGGTVDITYSQNPGTAFNVGTTQVDVTATDDLGNTDNCSFDVTVTDSEDPVAICPEDIMVNNDPGQCGAVVSFSASATDNCPGATAAAVPSSGSFFPVGITPITVTATDVSGKTDVCNFSVKVNDNEAPTFSNCPGNISVSNDLGDCGAIVNWTPPSLSDNCPSTSQNSSHNSGDFFSVGSTTVTYSGSDGAGNNAINCSFTVTVNDTEDPVPTCPSDISVNNDPGQCSAVVSFAASATDNCDANVEITYSQDPGTAFNVGTTTVDVTAKDDDNNSAGCSFDVTVTDNEAPIATCPASIPDVILNSSGNGTLPANIGDGSSTDNCSAVETSPTADFTCSDLGTQMVTLTATDPAGGTNMINCSFNVVDNGGFCNQPPVANCKNITVSTALNTCEATITPTQVDDNSSDPDNDPLQLSLDDSGPFGPGTHTVELTVSDGNLSATCTAMVTVEDNQAPSFSNCPGNISVSNDSGDCGAVVNWTPPTFGDNCPGAISSSTHDPGDFFPVGTTVVTYSGSDAAGNAASNCVFTVTVNDTEDPAFSSCPGNISVSNDSGDCGAIVNWTPPTFDDNCPGAISSSTHDPGDFFPVGTTVVTYSGSDAAGNAASNCVFTVTVNDTEDPAFSSCPGNISVSNDSGDCGAIVNWTPPTFVDNCPGETSSSTHDSGDFFDVGTTTVTYSGMDAAGNNAANCSFTVTVNDTEDPTFSNCPGNITMANSSNDCGSVVSWTPPTLSDNCPGAITSASHDPGGYFPVGTTTVSYNGKDAADNVAATCSFTITINDEEKPNISCPANITTSNDPGMCGAEISFTPPDASDNCEVKEVKARYRTVDQNNNPTGNWTSRMFDPSGFFPVGRYQVQWRAEDIYNNKRSCSHYLEVFDGEDPVAVCKDVTVDFNGEQDINLTVAQVWDESASSDNCGTVEFVSADLSIGCEELGNTVAIPVTIKDGAGNEDDCTAYVDVIGLPCGWAEGPNDGSLNCDGQTTSDYDVDDESFTLTSDGCWHDCRDADRATYVYHPLCGDGTFTAKLASINTSGYAGLMARESLDPWARRAGVLKNYSTRRVRREWRSSYGGIVAQSHSNRSRVKWLRIVRKGNEIKSYTSTNGSYWRLLYKVTFPNLEDCIYVGMTAYSLNGNAKVEATFEDVTISGNGSLAGGIFNDDTDTAFTPDGIQGWGTVGNVGNGTIEIFPNPASNQAQIVLDGFADEAAQLLVRDAFGKVVRQIDLDSALGVVMPLEVQDLAPGVYLISLVQSERLVISKRLVIQK